ncbi:hypothetical protein Tco_1485466 [Tanacetum coccineum]
MGRSESIFGMTSNTLYQIPSEPSRQEEFENLVMNFILDQEEKVKQLEEYMGVIRNDFMQLSLERIVPNMIKKCSNPTSAISDETIANPNAQIVGDDMVRVKIPKCMSWLYAYDEPIGYFDMMEDKVDNPSPQSTPQVLLSFEVYTPSVTYSEEVEDTLGTPMEVEPLEET